MAETTVSPNNVRVRFRGKPEKEPMAKKSAGIQAAPSSPSSDDWEAKDALRTMQRAEEHQADPHMMKRVAKHAKKESDGLTAVMAKLQKRGLVSDKQAAKTARKRAGAEAK